VGATLEKGGSRVGEEKLTVIKPLCMANHLKKKKRRGRKENAPANIDPLKPEMYFARRHKRERKKEEFKNYGREKKRTNGKLAHSWEKQRGR